MTISKIVVLVIAMVAMTGMAAVAAADTTTQTYIGDGAYSTSWSGNSGEMYIDTYTSNGQDHLAVDYQNGYSYGSQNGDTNGWTTVNREVRTQGRDTSISAVTIDNSGDLIAINTEARRGQTYLGQTVYTDDDVFGYDVDGVASIHTVTANGRSPSASIYTRAGDAYTVVDLDNRYGYVGINGMAAAGSGYGYAATGQMFEASAYGRGDALIATSGDYVGVGAYVHNGGYSYSAYGNGMTYIELDDSYNRYHARGYVYAVDLP